MFFWYSSVDFSMELLLQHFWDMIPSIVCSSFPIYLINLFLLGFYLLLFLGELSLLSQRSPVPVSFAFLKDGVV
jgi:hypothetical protein